MNKYQPKIYFFLCLVILLVARPGLAANQKQPISDMRILIDISGSMKQNDPNNLRAPALRLLVGLLPNKSRAGVWTFGQQVNMQVKLDDVSDAWKKYARNEANKIHSYGLFTNIEDALTRATFDWKKPDPDYQRTLILLTDGMVDISKDPVLNKKSRNRIISKILPQLSNADVKIHTIALSKNADHQLMKKLATRTNGWYSNVSSANELKRQFLHLFEKSTQADAIPLKDNSFTVDKSVSEMTVLIFRTKNSRPTELISPKGESLNSHNSKKDMQWYQDAGYDMITIKNPVPGKWKAKAEIDPDNRVLVVTNLKLKSNKFNHNFLKGDVITIYADLEEENRIMKKQEFLKLVTFSLKINGNDNVYKLSDDGEHPDAKPRDGIFSSIIETNNLDESNEILIQAKGATFDRQLRHSFKVFKSPINISVKDPEDNQPFDFSVSIKPYLFLKGSISIQIELPDGKTLQPKPFVNQQWMAEIPTTYQGNNIQVNITGKRYVHSEPHQYSESYLLPSIVSEETVIEQPTKAPAPSVQEEKKEPSVKQVVTKATEPLPEKKKETKTPPPPAEGKKKSEEKDITTPPEEEASWFMVFIIVLVGNAVIFSGIYLGYLFWKKKRDSVLTKDTAVFEDEESDSDKEKTDLADKGESDEDEDAESIDSAPDESNEDNEAQAEEPEASSTKPDTKIEDTGDAINSEDEDILKQQIEPEEDPSEESAVDGKETPDNAEDQMEQADEDTESILDAMDIAISNFNDTIDSESTDDKEESDDQQDKKEPEIDESNKNVKS